MKLLLTRIGENSKVIITGDCEQVNRRDIVNKKSECGLAYAASHLKDLSEIGITEFLLFLDKITITEYLIIESILCLFGLIFMVIWFVKS